ncbi:hypothetical protein JFU03_22475 [Bacillus sp. TH44]|uniref:hypothetical protein n=1 Tax=unclassified Bacillus (in: firmicutes) TaxID=185979 RepID=UPI001911C7D3|nr:MULTISPECIES: hypothetical protein [unclassified Bacillus (in: firmicutes)]MBK5345952.1 hypothetical protein [Bacillus sp. TH45]MBK5360608.1 hypothetical protein [Bacillus sp. TH44]MBK5362378.1 hypothetical protein [Bacillus sp. TH50]
MLEKSINFLSQTKQYSYCQSEVVEQLAIANCFLMYEGKVVCSVNVMVQGAMTYCKNEKFEPILIVSRDFHNYGIYVKINVVKILSILYNTR